jgi:hypothetical protein
VASRKHFAHRRRVPEQKIPTAFCVVRLLSLLTCFRCSVAFVQLLSLVSCLLCSLTFVVHSLSLFTCFRARRQSLCSIRFIVANIEDSTAS